MNTFKYADKLARVFTYPDEQRNSYVPSWQEIQHLDVPGAGEKTGTFIRHVTDETLERQQEYYIATFDVQAMCYLDIGYVLYGEDYNRGIFLAHIKQEQEAAGNDYGSELPDHLPNILTLLPKMQDRELAEELVVSMMIPALEHMTANFQSETNVYKGMLEVLLGIMKLDFPDSPYEPFDFSTQKKEEAFSCIPQWKNLR